ncbi:unnamed protein product [Prorocentrum cordatum]|uniref:Uncharacterized protein n=1 Tax=Prorocentrum cordatum TaxID=2364126 RepID=A0ABN9W8M7_9DINO|nr:unnamed protein product [Polarella glacialis]
MPWRRFGLLALPCTFAFTCYPEYQFSWCNNATEASCVHEYAFSVGHFQRKLNDYYVRNRRPPLLEAFFLTKLPKPYQLQFLESNCAAPLIMAYLLVAEAKLPVDDDAMRFASGAMDMVNSLPDTVRPILDSGAWSFGEAVTRFEQTARDTEQAMQTFPALLGGSAATISVEFVVVHCREPLDWVEADLLPRVAGSLHGLPRPAGRPRGRQAHPLREVPRAARAAGPRAVGLRGRGGARVAGPGGRAARGRVPRVPGAHRG